MTTYDLSERGEIYSEEEITIRTPYSWPQFNLDKLLKDGFLDPPVEMVPDKWKSNIIEQPGTEDVDLDAVKTMTKFERRNSIISLDPEYLEQISYNYTPYHQFCLQYQLLLYLRQKLKSYQQCGIIITRKPIDSEMVVSVDLYEDDIKLNLDSKVIVQLQTEVNRIINMSPIHCPLFTISLDTKYPQAWLKTIVPRILLPPAYNSFFYRGTLYVSLQYSDFNTEYNSLSKLYAQKLDQLWSIGSIECNTQFANRWNLEPIVPYIELKEIETQSDIKHDEQLYERFTSQQLQYQIQKESFQQELNTINTIKNKSLSTPVIKTEPIQQQQREEIEQQQLEEIDQQQIDQRKKFLYMAPWDDTRFAPLKTNFLLNMLSSKTGTGLASIKVGINLVFRHLISSSLRQLSIINYIFDQDYLHLPASNFLELTLIVNQIFKSVTTIGSSRVIFICTAQQPLSINRMDPAFEQVEFYRVNDPIRPWIISQLVTENEAITSLDSSEQEANQLRNLIASQKIKQTTGQY